MDTMKQPERDNRTKKYGGWAMNISDTEAEKIVMITAMLHTFSSV